MKEHKFVFNEVASGLHVLSLNGTIAATVAEIKKRFTERERVEAEKQKNYGKIGVPSVEADINLIQSGSVSHVNVTTRWTECSRNLWH